MDNVNKSLIDFPNKKWHCYCGIPFFLHSEPLLKKSRPFVHFYGTQMVDAQDLYVYEFDRRVY